MPPGRRFQAGAGRAHDGGKTAAAGIRGHLPGGVLKLISLRAPIVANGVPTVPEAVVGKGGTHPSTFELDLESLIATMNRFCDALPQPCVRHAFFGEMNAGDWMRWGYLHCDHHLRQFGR